jgi:hypothetical protein
MTNPVTNTMGNEFTWPDCLLIDAIHETYQRDCSADTLPAAKLHARFVQELIEGSLRTAAFLRLELILCCAGRDIQTSVIERADLAAFRELADFVAIRYRNSPRMRLELFQRLKDALCRLPPREPKPRPGVIHVLAESRRPPIGGRFAPFYPSRAVA